MIEDFCGNSSLGQGGYWTGRFPSLLYFLFSLFLKDEKRAPSCKSSGGSDSMDTYGRVHNHLVARKEMKDE